MSRKKLATRKKLVKEAKRLRWQFHHFVDEWVKLISGPRPKDAVRVVEL